MINKDQTFCNTRRIHGICFQCERHIRNEANKKFKNNTLSTKFYEAIKANNKMECDGWVIYPIKD